MYIKVIYVLHKSPGYNIFLLQKLLIYVFQNIVI